MAAPRPIDKRRERVYSRREIEGLIADGRKIFVLDGNVVKADAWTKFHPGGEISILHMVGRDATDEVNALHSVEAKQRMQGFVIGRVEGRWTNFVPPIQGGRFRGIEETDDCPTIHVEADSSSSSSSRSSSPVFDPAEEDTTAVRQRKGNTTVSLRSSSVSSVSSVEVDTLSKSKMSTMDRRTQAEIDLDLSKYPALEPEVQDEIVKKYRLLQRRIEAEGLYQCRYTSYLIELCRYSLLFAGFLFFLRRQWWATSGFCLGAFWHQLVFTAHDSGHIGITHNYHLDSVIGIIIADYFGGLSLGWWKRNHNVHHIVTNSPEHDPDIEHMPFFAISHRFLGNLRSTYYNKVMEYDAFAKFFIRYQSYLYYIILLFGRFNLYVLSWTYLLGGQAPRKGPAWWHRWFEIVGQIVFWAWFGYFTVYKSIDSNWGRFVFVMVSHMVTMPLHVQITLSHFAMSTADLGTHESFPQKMLRTTMDVDCPQWLDFFHGGLQFQAIHHLYPRIPRHNLRRTQKLVQEFCEEVNIPYALFGFVDGNKEVIGKLADVGRQAAILAACQRSIASTPSMEMH